jgi:hypothetical protein
MRFLAEFYLPAQGTDLDGLATAFRSAAERPGIHDGRVVRFINAIYIPQDETCFVVFEAESAAAVAAAGELAGLTFDRIVQAMTTPPG